MRVALLSGSAGTLGGSLPAARADGNNSLEQLRHAVGS